MGEKKRENLENVKQEIESKRQRRKSESHDQPASEDLVDKIRQLDSIGKAAGNKRSKLRTTSDVTRMKMDIRYPSEKEAKDYFSHLQGQEQTKREIQSKEQARSLEPHESANGFETTVEMLEKKRLLFEEMRKNRNDNKTSCDDGTRLRSNSNPKVEESTTSKYRKKQTNFRNLSPRKTRPYQAELHFSVYNIILLLHAIKKNFQLGVMVCCTK